MLHSGTMPPLLSSILDQVHLNTIVDIGITALLIYWLFKLIRGTRAVRLVIGVSVLFLVYALAVALDLRLCIFRRRGQKRGSQDFDWSSLGVFRSWRVDPFIYGRCELLVERKSCPFRRHLTERYAGRTIAALHRPLAAGFR